MAVLSSILASKGKLALVVVLLAAATLATRLISSEPYTLTFLMPAADGSFVGAKVVMHGTPVGEVSGLDVKDGQAAVTIEIDDEHAPLPAGTTARVKWESVLGARVIEVLPGNEDNVALPSGHLLTDSVEAVELDDLLAMLDAPTRRQLQGLVSELAAATSGQENNLNQTLRAAGPTFKALGEVARSVGEDGPAIRQIVTQLHRVAESVAGHGSDVSASVAQLSQLTQAIATEQSDLSSMLDQLPGTIDTATETLSNVEGPVDSARTLLRQVQPTTHRLPSLAHDLRPVLAAARPALDDLPPTLRDADALLKRTPALVVGLNDLLPTVDDTLEQVNPMVSFLRPYTPELVGWLTNWTSLFASQNASGNYARALITASASSLDDVQPGVPPGQHQDPRPDPGSLADQPWTDANGDLVQ
jgi:phospholipid/cholesterol/gamma-HCH transport system substrate-binding protein